MDILQDSWFTVKQIAQNTYAISEYGTGIHPLQNFSIQFQLQKKMFPYKKTPFTFYPTFKGSKTPTSKFSGSKEVK